MSINRVFWRTASVIVLLGLLLFATSPRPASADVMPPPPPASANPLNGSTQVQMASETVVFEIASASSEPHGQAKVTATFHMHNAGGMDETMPVRFPLGYIDIGNGSLLTCNDTFTIGYTPINDLAAWVDGVSTPIRLETVTVYPPAGYGLTEEDIPCWAKFPVTFRAGKDTTLRVTYTAVGGGQSNLVPWDADNHESRSAWTEFHYILVTGAAWKGPIGSADVIFHFPYAVTPDLYDAVPGNPAVEAMTTSGNDLIWHREAFEPDSNVSIRLVTPSVWISILSAKKVVAANPKDSEAWGQLGKGYKGLVWERRGLSDSPYIQKSQDAYEQAVALAPNNPDWHFGYAELLCWKAIWSDTIDLNGCLKQLNATLKLRPNDSKALGVLWLISQLLPGSLPDDLVQTAQPTATASQTPTATFIPAVPGVTDTPRPTDTLRPVITFPPGTTATALHFPQETPAILPSSTSQEITHAILKPEDSPTPSPAIPPTSVPAPGKTGGNLVGWVGLFAIVGLGVGFLILRKGK